MTTTSSNANQALWEKGDFTRIAASMRQSGDTLVDRLGIDRDAVVLDVGCGDGTTALPAARRATRVLGVDIARNLVDAGNRRAVEAGRDNLQFRHGDASDLCELADAEFDVTMSFFGAMFAPRPFDVARELVRVTRPGGRIVMGNWIPGDPTVIAEILRICMGYLPPPPEGAVGPMLWGIETEAVARFAAAGVPTERIACTRETFTFSIDRSPEEFLTLFREFYGPTMNAYAAAAQVGREAELHAELLALFVGENRSRAAGRVEIPATFLQVAIAR